MVLADEIHPTLSAAAFVGPAPREAFATHRNSYRHGPNALGTRGIATHAAVFLTNQ